MTRYKLLLVVLIFLFFTSCGSVTKRETNDSVNNLESLQKLKGAIVSGYVVDMDSKEVIASFNENYRMTPASLSKIFTSASALIQLGQNFRFKTIIGISNSNVNNDVLNGNLIISGGGDPTLGSKYFESTYYDSVFRKILLTLKNRGISSISGDLVIVSDYFSLPRYPSKRLWEDMSNYYGAPPSGLTFFDNTFVVTLESPQKIGALCKVVDVAPDCDIEFDCRVIVSASQKDSAYIYGFPGLKRWYVDGSIPAGRRSFKIKGAVPQPEKVFGRQLMDYLEKSGMSITGLSYKTSAEASGFELIGEIDSPPLSLIIKALNKKSINLYADHLFLMQAKQKGKADWNSARKVSSAFWQKSIGQNDIYLHDGSGLSPFNHCSPIDMVNVLMFMSKSELSDVFKNSLSISGIDGTLKRIWATSETQGRVFGKSGYMKGVLGYAGYLTTNNNRKFAFCIIVNRFAGSVKDVRKLIEQEITKIILEN